MITIPAKWVSHATPEGSTQDEKGYVVPPAYEQEGESWGARIISSMSSGNDKSMEKQRELGFKYYDQDPGREPHEMNPHEQSTVTGAFWSNVCTLL
jgi:hypothetical protein